MVQTVSFQTRIGTRAGLIAAGILLALVAISVGVVDAAGRVCSFVAHGLGVGLPLMRLLLRAGAPRRSIARAIARLHVYVLKG